MVCRLEPSQRHLCQERGVLPLLPIVTNRVEESHRTQVLQIKLNGEQLHRSAFDKYKSVTEQLAQGGKG